MNRLFLTLVALGVIALGVVLAVVGTMSRAPDAPPFDSDDRFMRVKVEEEAPRGAAPMGNAEAPGGTERVDRLGAVDIEPGVLERALGGEAAAAAFEGVGDGGGGQGIGKIGTKGLGGRARVDTGGGRPPEPPESEVSDEEGEEVEPEATVLALPKPRPARDHIARLGARMPARKAPPVELDKDAYAYDLKEKSKVEALDRNAPYGDDGLLDIAAGPVDLAQLRLDGQAGPEVLATDARPDRFLPRTCYFENTYLGGNAAYQERLRRLEADLGGGPHLLAALEPQPFDAPEDAGLRLTATLDRSHLDRPGRVLLQVGLQGSRRYGWRRPPLDIALVVDAGSREVLVPAAEALLKRLGPQDRLAIVQAGEGEVVPLADRRVVRTALARRAEGKIAGMDDVFLEQALETAGRLLSGSDDQARVPGTRTLVLLTDSGRTSRIDRARAQVQALAEQGVVTSVVAMGVAHDAGWWRVATAGNGNLHRAQGTAGLGEVMEAELASLARVIARLLRVNIRLAPNVEAIRVLGSRVLGQEEVREVKAREVATDRNLSRSLGVKADRGDDDDGIQTVIPYFYGGDSHVILVELWVEKPGPVAEISLRYKDMVNLENATARTSTALSTRPRADARAQAVVLRNLDGFSFSEALKRAAVLTAQGDRAGAQAVLRQGARTPADRRVGEAFVALLSGGIRTELVRDALVLAADRRIGTPAEER